ncbi:MAG: methionine--tRNA ligase [Candidatus Shikimatogenerans bostrichidophilus]|nr:MAG: methionine--tRNA ligase [Candidatus Shikimatogenerans bostrichidophilus]
MKNKKKIKYIITSAFPYTNGNLHIGHLSGVFIPADIYYRYLKSFNKKVLFLSGSDENGSSIVIESIKKKKKIIDLVNKYHIYIKKYLKKFNILLSNYYRTSDKKHHLLVKKIFKKLYYNNLFILKQNKQYYDKYHNQFLADRYVIGICPFCKEKKVFSDQCNKCGNLIKDNKIIKPISILSNKKPIFKKTYNLFFLFKKEKKYIKKLIKNFKNKKFKKNIINTMKSFLKSNLIDKSITRDLKWGVDVPINNKIFKDKKIYVWFEALIGYLSSTIDYDIKNKTNWYKYWKNKNTKLIMFIGKDNIFFHSILLPIILNRYNKKFILPSNIPANEFLKLEGKKISTSNNWAIWLHEYLKYFPKMQDILRFSLIMDMPENKDTNFTWKKFQIYNNSILIGIIGNYFNRVVVLINKYYNGRIPNKNNKYLDNIDKIILKKINKYTIKIFNFIKKFKFKLSLYYFIKLSKLGNKYLSYKEPWKIKNKKKIDNILFISSQIIGYISFLSYYFLPKTHKIFLKIISIKKCDFNILKKKKFIFKKNHKINKNKIIFRKITNKEIFKQIKIIKNNENKKIL